MREQFEAKTPGHSCAHFWPAVLLAGLLILSACGAASTPAADGVATAPPSALPATVAEATATPLPTEETVATASAVTVAVSPLSPPPTALPDTPTPAPTQEATATSPSPEAEGEGNADVLHVRAVQADDGSWMFQVTVEHPDTGWEDYADGWDVVTPDGEVLKPDAGSPFTRLLLHPHEAEQPFTRSQSGIVIPPGVTQVRVRAHDLVDGWGGREVVVDLTVQQGEDFEVEVAP